MADINARYFPTITDVTKFINDTDNHVSSVVSINFDSTNGKWALFFYSS